MARPGVRDPIDSGEAQPCRPHSSSLQLLGFPQASRLEPRDGREEQGGQGIG